MKFFDLKSNCIILDTFRQGCNSFEIDLFLFQICQQVRYKKSIDF